MQFSNFFGLAPLAELFTILFSAVSVVGGAIAVARWWGKRQEGPKAERQLLHAIDTRLTGEDPSPLNPDPPSGLIEDVANVRSDVAEVKQNVGELRDLVLKNQTEYNVRIDAIESSHAELKRGQEKILKGLVPNGLRSDMPGDVLQHVLRQNEVILQRLGVDPAVCDPKSQADPRHPSIAPPPIVEPPTA